MVELIEAWQSFQFNIETSLIDLQPWRAKEGKVRPKERPEEVGKFPGSLNIPFPSINMELLSCDVLADTLNRDAFEPLLAIISLKI